MQNLDNTDNAHLNASVDTLASLVRSGKSVDEASRMLAMLGLSDDQLKRVVAEYHRLAGTIRSLREPGGIVDPELESWYIGPQDGDRFWPALERHLARKGWSPNAISSLDDASSKVVSLLKHPGAGTIQTRGLVVGHVQSGKTANFTAVISKAADVNYRLFIVLSGMTNSLRNQTQARLLADLEALNPESWISITDTVHDFRITTNVNAFLGGEAQGLKILGVVKKNKYRLARLLTWLGGARPEILRSCPVLIVDDEADQGSPNSARLQEERTAINGLLVRLLKALPKAAYVGYTATPFANFLIDPIPDEDLYPRDFIIDLPTSESYFGTERIFGREPLDWEEPDALAEGLDVIREVPTDEIPLLRPVDRQSRSGFQPEVTPSLEAAVRYFLMAAAARRARGQAGEHCSMLVHTSEYTAVHDGFEQPLAECIASLRRSVTERHDDTLNALEHQWADEQLRLPPEDVGQMPVTFATLTPFLAETLSAVEVKLEHGASDNRLDYDTPGRLYIVVGGNVLARGLTIEGLTVSFFIRSASAYDTLLQMGRWFGYRFGYEDLPRLWMTAELREHFEHLAVVEREIRREIDRYKNKRFSPKDFGPRIRTHPHLAITSKLKMQHARTAEMSFAGKTPQTIVFKSMDVTWLNENIAAARSLLGKSRARATPARVNDRPHLIFRDVPVADILQFLQDYHIHPDQVEMPSTLLRSYIRSQNAKDKLKTWHVGIITSDEPSRPTIELGLDSPVHLIRRSKYDRREDDAADIKALMSALDIAADLDVSYSELTATTRTETLDRRDQAMPDRGLLLIYPIDKDSTPPANGKDPKRVPLEAKQHVIGLALVFPNPKDNTPQGYVTVEMPVGIEIDEVEVEEDQDE